MGEFTNEIECPECEGEGRFWNNADPTSGQSVDCDACNGHGWREMTEEEANDAAANAWSDLCESEPPITMQERYEAAAKQKRELRR